MKRKRTLSKAILRQTIIGAVSGMVVAPLMATLLAPELLWQFALWGTVSGAIFGGVQGLGHDSLWSYVAGANSLIILATFVAVLIVLPIDFTEVSLLMIAILVAGFLMALLTSFMVIRPLQQLTDSTQSIAKQNLSQRVPVAGARELRTLAQSFNSMVEALESAEANRRQILADVSHELRTPLTVLQSNLRAILDDVVDPEKEQIITLYSQTRQLNRLVDDLHDLAQADAQQLPLNRTELELNSLIAQAGELFTPLAEEAGIVLRTSTPEQRVTVYGDRKRLIQVLQNLLGNGMRHANHRLDLRLWTEAAMACVEVADDGDGIAAEHLPYVFDRFYRVDRARAREAGGSGLGLAISQAFVKAHGGRMTLRSDGVGKGTTVCFELPMLSSGHQ